MPLYDYECSNCEHLVEDVFQKVTDKPLKKCPECGKHKLFKLISGGLHSSVVGNNTIGSQADKNARNNKTQIAEAEAKQSEENPAAPKPWYHGEATTKEINQMSPTAKKRYIMEGRK